MDHIVRLLLHIEKLFTVYQQGIDPPSIQPSQALLNVFLSWANGVFALFGLKETTDKGFSDTHDLAIHLITELPFVFRKHA
jgi:hypothetical protein